MCRNNTFKAPKNSRFSLVRRSTIKGFVLNKYCTIEVSQKNLACILVAFDAEYPQRTATGKF
jgi:hypothetical protein